MNTTISVNGKNEDAICFFANSRKGYGQWSIECMTYCKGESKTFSIHSTDSRFIDNLSELESTQEKQQFYYDTFFRTFEECIIEWAETIKN